jgi:hypothetical protein
VVPIVTLATSSGLMLDWVNMALMTLLMPSLGFLVVLSFFHATMPLSGAEERVRSRITPSVFVLLCW